MILIQNSISYYAVRNAICDKNQLIYYWNMQFLLNSENSRFQ